jgi:hypothetical protein
LPVAAVEIEIARVFVADLPADDFEYFVFGKNESSMTGGRSPTKMKMLQA